MEGKEWKTKSREREQKFDARALHCRYVHWTRKQTARSSTQMDISVINDKRSSCHSGRIPRTIRFLLRFFFLPLLLFLLLHYSYFFFPSFFFLLCSLFTCNTSVRNRVVLNESVGVYRSWQYFKSALLRQMQRVGQVRPGIHLNSLLRHI